MFGGPQFRSSSVTHVATKPRMLDRVQQIPSEVRVFRNVTLPNGETVRELVREIPAKQSFNLF